MLSQDLGCLPPLSLLPPSPPPFPLSLSSSSFLHFLRMRSPRKQDTLNKHEQSLYELTETEAACQGLQRTGLHQVLCDTLYSSCEQVDI